MKHKIIVLLTVLAVFLAACSGASGAAPAPTLNASQQQGQAVFNLRCAQCHAAVPDTVIIGPSLAGIATRAETRVEGYDARTYLETSIISPGSYLVEGFADTMPKNFGKDLTSEELDAVVLFLMTIE